MTYRTYQLIESSLCRVLALLFSIFLMTGSLLAWRYLGLESLLVVLIFVFALVFGVMAIIPSGGPPE